MAARSPVALAPPRGTEPRPAGHRLLLRGIHVEPGRSVAADSGPPACDRSRRRLRRLGRRGATRTARLTRRSFGLVPFHACGPAAAFGAAAGPSRSSHRGGGDAVGGCAGVHQRHLPPGEGSSVWGTDDRPPGQRSGPLANTAGAAVPYPGHVEPSPQPGRPPRIHQPSRKTRRHSGRPPGHSPFTGSLRRIRYRPLGRPRPYSSPGLLGFFALMPPHLAGAVDGTLRELRRAFAGFAGPASAATERPTSPAAHRGPGVSAPGATGVARGSRAPATPRTR